jgi:hypothetical protein
MRRRQKIPSVNRTCLCNRNLLNNPEKSTRFSKKQALFPENRILLGVKS